MEPVGGTHRMALRLPMQREESRRIAKLYEFTGKAGLGSNFSTGSMVQAPEWAESEEAEGL